MEAPETEPRGPPRFKCPEDFTAAPFAPGPPFTSETLQDPTKQFWLIRAPANFSPESLNGQPVPLSGFETLMVLQPDKTHKVYSLQATPGASVGCARLLVPTDHQDQLTCAPPFAGSLNVRERFGDPSAHQILFPVTNRLAPQIPDGLRQRFLPFGGQPKRPLPPPSGDAQMPPRKKKKKRQVHTMDYMGDPDVLGGSDHEQPFGECTTPFQEPREGGRQKERSEGLPLFSAVKQQSEGETQPESALETSSQEGLVSGEAEELSHRIKKKKKKKHKEEMMENRGLVEDPGCLSQQSQVEPQPVENGDSGAKGLALPKHKKKKRHQEENIGEPLWTFATPEEETERKPCEESGVETVVEGSLDLTEEDPVGDRSDHKSRKKKKKRRKEKVEEGESLGQEMGPMLLEPSVSVKQELVWDELDVAPGQGIEWTDSLGLSTEGSSQKHKKKKKKKGKEKEEEREAP